MVKAANGFVWRPEKPDAENFVRQKWGWSGQGPGTQVAWRGGTCNSVHLFAHMLMQMEPCSSSIDNYIPLA